MRRSAGSSSGDHRPRVVVIGMGDTGTLVATRLAPRAHVVAVCTRPGLVSGQELGTRLADPTRWRSNYLIPLSRFRRLDGVEVLHGRVTRLDPRAATVEIDMADGRVTMERYDAVVIASGVTNGFWRHDRVQTLAQVSADLDAVQSDIDAAATIAVIGGGASGVSAAANLARRHPAKRVHLFHSGDEPLPHHHPRARRWAVDELARAGVHRHPNHRATMTPESETGSVTSGRILWSTGQEPAEFDAVIWAVGQVRPNTGFLPADLLDQSGFVLVDPHLRSPIHPNVFAIGDVAASDPLRSSARNWGYRVVATNVRRFLRGQPKRMRRFRASPTRWGSIVGIQADGLTVFGPTGRSFRIPRGVAQPLLFDLWTHTVMYGGTRKRDDAGS